MKADFIFLAWELFVLSKENINSRSLPELKAMLKKNDFEVQFEKRWSYRFWKFYLVEEKK